MRLDNKIGLIALVFIIVLIVLYLIKQKYKEQEISTTFIWNKSLKYLNKPKKRFINFNILLFLLQFLIIILLILVITIPIIDKSTNKDKVIIIDSSANMLMKDENNITKFDKSKKLALNEVNKYLQKGDTVTIIKADIEPQIIVNKSNNYNEIENKINSLECSYSNSNVKKSLDLAKTVLSNINKDNTKFYTMKNFKEDLNINIVNLKNDNDFNVSIQNLKSFSEDGYYKFEAEVLSSNENKKVNIILNVFNINNKNESITLNKEVNLKRDKLTKIVFDNTGIINFEKAEISFKLENNEEDIFSYDDKYYLYNSKKEIIKIQYSSLRPNSFIFAMLNTLKQAYKNDFDIQTSDTLLNDAETSNFDIYIFEHKLPKTIPNDGLVILINPNSFSDFSLTVLDEVNKSYKFEKNMEHPILNSVDVSKIEATVYKPIVVESESYDILIKNENDENIMVALNSENKKLLVLSLDLNRSNLPIILEFPVLLKNIFNYFYPNVINKNVYNVNEEIKINKRSDNISIKSEENNIEITNKDVFKPEKPGKYTIKNLYLSNKSIEKDIFVKIPNEQSNLLYVNNENININNEKNKENNFDIYLYLSIAILSLLIIERSLSYFRN